MNKQQNKRIWDWNPKPRSVIIVGILLFLLVVLVHGHTEYQIHRLPGAGYRQHPAAAVHQLL